VGIVFPHRNEVLGADDERFSVVIVLEHLGQSGGHHRLAQADHIADQHTAALVQVVRGNLDGSNLEVEQRFAKNRRDTEFRKACTRFLSKVECHLEVDMIGRHQTLTRPALVDDVGQFLGNIDAPTVAPAIFKPIDQLVAGIVLQHIDVQFPLLGQARKREVRATQKAGDRVVGILPMQQIELGVQGVAQIHLDDQLLGTNLNRELP